MQTEPSGPGPIAVPFAGSRAEDDLFFKRIVLALLLVLLIAGSLLPTGVKRAIGTQSLFHRPIHLVVFALASILTQRAFPRSSFVLASGGLAALGFLLEWGEHAAYHSHLEWRDVGDDLIGIGIGLAIVYGARHFCNRKLSRSSQPRDFQI